ncbi:hypothetical protein GCM10023257_10120 [Streptomyces hyderabadensis]|uniref:Uncharacterized protein n=1 Tax=Streptomyces hyderabadensis TaxID=598549 RepID=A0ABP9HNY6_9ACTN
MHGDSFGIGPSGWLRPATSRKVPAAADEPPTSHRQPPTAPLHGADAGTDIALTDPARRHEEDAARPPGGAVGDEEDGLLRAEDGAGEGAPDPGRD